MITIARWFFKKIFKKLSYTLKHFIFLLGFHKDFSCLAGEKRKYE